MMISAIPFISYRIVSNPRFSDLKLAPVYLTRLEMTEASSKMVTRSMVDDSERFGFIAQPEFRAFPLRGGVSANTRYIISVGSNLPCGRDGFFYLEGNEVEAAVSAPKN